MCYFYARITRRAASSGLSSKSWEVFGKPDAPRMDLVITVCDNAAGEVCPVWPGQPVTAHWGYADPSAVSGSDTQRSEAFAQTMHLIRKRLESLTRLRIQTTVRDLAKP